MDLNASILKDIRVAVGLSAESSDFDTDLLMHINTAIAELNQNGVGNVLVVKNEEQKWIDLQNPLQVEGNQYFSMIPLFITISTKLLFDPPPPSTVQYYAQNANKILWRLKIAYEEPNISVVVSTIEGSE